MILKNKSITYHIIGGGISGLSCAWFLKKNKNISYIRCSIWNNEDIINHINDEDIVVVKGTGSIKKYSGADGIVRDVFNLKAQSVELNNKIFCEGVNINELRKNH